jgi:hypothetical protein
MADARVKIFSGDDVSKVEQEANAWLSSVPVHVTDTDFEATRATRIGDRDNVYLTITYVPTSEVEASNGTGGT